MSRIAGSLLLLFFLAAFAVSVHGQQLLIMKKGKVIARYNPGDEIYFELKDQRQMHHAVLQSLREFYFVTVHGDTIQHSRVARIGFKSEGRKKYGMVTALMGLGLLGVYGLNAIAFDENSTSMRGLRLVGLLAVGSGMIIWFTSESSVRINGVRRLKHAAYDSPLYR
jgi:hypothetical protein